MGNRVEVPEFEPFFVLRVELRQKLLLLVNVGQENEHEHERAEIGEEEPRITPISG